MISKHKISDNVQRDDAYTWSKCRIGYGSVNVVKNHCNCVDKYEYVDEYVGDYSTNDDMKDTILWIKHDLEFDTNEPEPTEIKCYNYKQAKWSKYQQWWAIPQIMNSKS